MDTDAEYKRKIEQLEGALIKYIERYGMSDSAREALAQVEEIGRQSIVKPGPKLVKPS